MVELDLCRPWYTEWNWDLCPWSMNGKPFGQHLPLSFLLKACLFWSGVGRSDAKEGLCSTWLRSGTIWKASHTIAFDGSQMWREPHALQLFPFYFGHSPLFSNIFSKLICQYYSINCLLSTTIIIKSNGSFLVFVEGAAIVRYIDKNSSSTLRYICIY